MAVQTSVPPYPVRVGFEAPLEVARWRVIGNPIMAIPHFVVLAVLGIYLAILEIVAWFAILFTGNIPRGIYDQMVGILRYGFRVTTFYLWMRESYPKFGFKAADVDPGDDPATLSIPYPTHLSRGMIFVKSMLVYPQLFVFFFVGIAMYALVVVGWFAVLFTGRWPEGMRTFVVGAMRWSLRINAYTVLLTDAYPPYTMAAEPAKWSGWAIYR